MATSDGLTVVLGDGRSEWFASAPVEEVGYETYDDDGRPEMRWVAMRRWTMSHRVDADGSLVVLRTDRDLEYGQVVATGSREVARFRAGLWDYVRES